MSASPSVSSSLHQSSSPVSNPVLNPIHPFEFPVMPTMPRDKYSWHRQLKAELDCEPFDIIDCRVPYSPWLMENEGRMATPPWHIRRGSTTFQLIRHFLFRQEMIEYMSERLHSDDDPPTLRELIREAKSIYRNATLDAWTTMWCPVFRAILKGK